MGELKVTVVIPTYGRESVLVETLEHTLALEQPADAVIVVDQTVEHTPAVAERLASWETCGAACILPLSPPSIPRAMNIGLQASRTELVLYMDDDVLPSPGLVREHVRAHSKHPEALAVVGQILQPGEEPRDVAYQPSGSMLRRYLDFPFYCCQAQPVENVSAGNLSVKRIPACTLGGFDENYGTFVAFRFETEFAKRAVRQGHQVWFEPRASLHHLRAPSGGTRVTGSHLTSPSPMFGVGDYYYALTCGRGADKLRYMLHRPFREIRTRFHLRHPWYMPVKLLGELRAAALAYRLYRAGPKFPAFELEQTRRDHSSVE